MTHTKIPIYDPTPEIEELWDEINAAIQGVLRSGHFIMGPNVKAFEEEAAAYLGVKHAVSMNSGTDALVIGLRALGIGPGDEVITTPFTFFATAEAISAVGATPVFVDIDPLTYNIDPALIPAAITERTKAIIPVHLYGQACDMASIMKIANTHGVKVLEDCAQSMGARYTHKQTGTIGHAGAYSFFPTKTLGCFGDGGLLATNDDTVADLARMLRVHGSRKKYHNEVVGYNSRLDEIQAAILRIKLPRLDLANGARRRVAHAYNHGLSKLTEVKTPQHSEATSAVFHQYTIRAENGSRDALRIALDNAGISSMIYYPVPVDQLPLYQSASCPQSERAAREVLSLPIWPTIPPATINEVVKCVCNYYGSS